MGAQETTSIEMQTSLVKELEPLAKRMGLSVPAYLAFLARVGVRQHDPEFVNAARYVFSKFPNALRKLAQ